MCVFVHYWFPVERSRDVIMAIDQTLLGTAAINQVNANCDQSRGSEMATLSGPTAAVMEESGRSSLQESLLEEDALCNSS